MNDAKPRVVILAVAKRVYTRAVLFLSDLMAEIRHLFITLAQRRQHPGAGSRREFLLTRTAKVKWFDLNPVLSPLSWVVIGAVATRHYMPERMTHDLDIAIRVVDRDEVHKRFKANGFTYSGELSIGGSSWTTLDGTIIDVIEPKSPWWNEALAEAQSNRDLQELPILSLRFLVLMKFQAGRVQDLADVTRMLGQSDDEALDRVRHTFAVWAPEDCDDLESLISLGKLETQLPAKDI